MAMPQSWLADNAEVDRRVLSRLRGRDVVASRATIVDSLKVPWANPSYEAIDEAVGRSLQRLRRRGLVSASGFVWQLVNADGKAAP